MKRKVEFIESYIKVGNDYQWFDNHGELIRCKDCKAYNGMKCVRNNMIAVRTDDYCSRAERRGEE